jgi:stage II sporulation protein D
VLRGPLTVRPPLAASVSRVQVGAFSEESAAREVASRDSERFHLPASVAFSAEKGLYLVRLGEFSDPGEARSVAAQISSSGVEAFVATESAAGGGLFVRDESGKEMRLSASALGIAPPDSSTLVEFHGKKYRGSLRILINPRGLLNVVNVVEVEDYLRGVVPAEMGPKRFDELEALKAQAVAARTYALDGVGRFEAEGYDICATPKCQVYAGAEAEDPMSDEAVRATRGLVLESQGKLIHALFASTCGGRTEDVNAVFPSMTGAYLKGVPCGEAEATLVAGARRPRREARLTLDLLEWRGEVLLREPGAHGKTATRQALWEEALALAGKPSSPAPESLLGSAVYPAVLTAFGLEEAQELHLTKLDRAYDAGPPDPAGKAPEAAASAYETLLRLNFGGEAALPSPDRKMSEREFAGLLFSVALRLGGVTEVSGRFVRREGGSLIVKTPSGRLTIPADVSIELARQVGAAFTPSGELTLRAGDRVKIWKRNSDVLAFWAEFEPEGGSVEKESAWTEWVRRLSGRELVVKSGGRLRGREVQNIEITRRGASGRAIEGKITTDQGSATFSGFELRQVLGLPELLFTVDRASAADGSPEFVFLGRGWGHGVGLCQNGSYGMALEGKTFEEILKHYYTGVEIAPYAGETAKAASP